MHRHHTGIMPLVSFVTLAVAGGPCVQTAMPQAQDEETSPQVRLTVLYDNYGYRPSVHTDWGFSCLVELPETTLLFDTGARPDILRANSRVLGVDLASVDTLVLSHDHQDHVGGLSAVLSRTQRLDAWTLESFPDGLLHQLRDANSTVHTAISPTEIAPSVYLTGELGARLGEQALVIDSAEGLVVVTGCAHPGPVCIARRTLSMLEGPIHLMVGGFHLLNASEGELEEVIEELASLGVQRVAPSHCSGERARSLFKRAYGERFLESGVGRVFTMPCVAGPTLYR
jgi:7,8-dihydropterin-6-yl-methyl-4-(beta-D-ribofuranosyl)aminobenzene 5'-phosphate synthase